MNTLCCHCGQEMKNHSVWDGHSPVPIGCTCGYHEASKMKALEPDCPDYLNELNAMHEAEKVLTLNQHFDYTGRLEKTLNGFCAPADQRAEFFLRTLGLWT